MSTSCSLLISPTRKRQQQQATLIAGSGSEADLFNVEYYTHLHDISPRSSRAAYFKRPSSINKWPKAVLAHLAPLRLLQPAPITASSSSSSTKRRPCDTPAQRRRVQAAISAGDTNSSSAPQRPCLLATGSPITTIGPATETSQLTASFSSSLLNTADSANDVEQLLHILLAPSLSNDINTRTRILTALCTLLHAPAPPGTAVHKFVAAGGVEIILNILDSTTQPSRPPPPIAAIHVEESEKALLLLQLSTSCSPEACTAALQHSASITAALGKKLLRISETCTASAIAVLTSLCRHSDSNAALLFRKAVSKTAIPSKLVVVLQVASKDSTKRRAARLLRLLGEEQEQEQHNSSLLPAPTVDRTLTNVHN